MPSQDPDPVALTVHSMPPPDALALERRTRSGRVKMLLVLAACAAPVVASYFMYYVVQPAGGRTNYGQLIQPTHTLPASLPLKALDGSPVSTASLRGQWLLVSIGGGACDAACETRLYTQRQLRQMLGRERDRLDKLWLVTDDTPIKPELLQAISSVEPVQVLRVPRDALAGWLQPAAGHTLDEHLYLVDPMGEWMMRMPADPEPARVKKDLERLLRASASWDKAGR